MSETQYELVVIGGSAGSFNEVRNILGRLPSTFGIPVLLVLHRLKHVANGFKEALAISSTLPVIEPEDKEILKPGVVYIAPANYHLLLSEDRTVSLSDDILINHSRPSIDATFESASYLYREKLIGVILSGANRDGMKGMAQIKQHGGLCLVQDPEEAQIDTMPNAAIRSTSVDMVASTGELADYIITVQNHNLQYENH